MCKGNIHLRRYLLYLQYGVTALIFYLYHKLSAYILSHHIVKLQLSPDAAPLFGIIQISISNWVVFSVISYIAFILLVYLIEKKLFNISTVNLLIAFMVIKFFTDISISISGLGTAPIVFKNGIMQYLKDVLLFSGLKDIFSNYVSKMYVLTTHSGTHPPGPVMVLWIVTRMFGYSPEVKFFFIIFTAPFIVIPLYFLARETYGEKIAKYTVLLYVVTPSAVMYSVASMDAFFAIFLVTTLFFYIKTIHTNSLKWGVLTGIFLTISSLLTFASSFLVSYFAVLMGLTFLLRRDRFLIHLKTFITTIATFTILLFILKILTGFNFISCLKEAMHIDTYGSVSHLGCGTGYETPLRYFFISFTNLFAFFTGIGIPTTTLWLRQVKSSLKAIKKASFKDIFLISFVITLIVNAFAALYTAETERIWLFLVPFVLAPAANDLKNYIINTKNRAEPYITFSLLYLQTLLFEIFIQTIW